MLLRGERIELSQKEFSLLRTLASQPTKVWTKEELLRTVWGFRSPGATRTLDSHACRLRQKLGTQGDRFVINMWGVGYRLVDADPHRRPVAAGGAARAFHRRRARTGGVMALATSLALAVALGLWLVERRRRRACAELVARAAHELRGPLAAAHLGLQTLGRQAGVPRWRCAAIDVQLQRAALAVADLAAAPRGASAGDVSGLVDVGRLLEEQLRAWRPMARAYDCDLRLAPVMPGSVVRGDRLRLGQAIGNVLANAVEHGRGRIELSVREHGGRVRIEIADDGPGLPAPVVELAASPRAGRGRRGRGLAIASDIARRHGGRLAAAPSERGARLALELPVVAAPDRAAR